MLAIAVVVISGLITNSANAQNNPTRIVTGMFEYPVGTNANQATDSVEQRGYEIKQPFNNPREGGYCTDYPRYIIDTPEACVARINPDTGQHYRWLYRHSGLDINQERDTDCNDPVYAPADGVVINVVSDPYPRQNFGSGNMIRLRHRTFDCIFYTMY